METRKRNPRTWTAEDWRAEAQSLRYTFAATDDMKYAVAAGRCERQARLMDRDSKGGVPMTARLEMFVRFTDGTGRTLHAVEDTPLNRRTLDRMAAHLMAKPNVREIAVNVQTGRTAGYERSR